MKPVHFVFMMINLFASCSFHGQVQFCFELYMFTMTWLNTIVKHGCIQKSARGKGEGVRIFFTLAPPRLLNTQNFSILFPIPNIARLVKQF